MWEHNCVRKVLFTKSMSWFVQLGPRVEGHNLNAAKKFQGAISLGVIVCFRVWMLSLYRSWSGPSATPCFLSTALGRRLSCLLTNDANLVKHVNWGLLESNFNCEYIFSPLNTVFADEQKQICGKVIVDQLLFVAQITKWPRWC